MRASWIDDNAATIEDLNSKNGTTLCEVAVTGPSTLHDGDRIQVGPILVVFHASASVLSTATASGRPPQLRRSRKSP